MHYIITDTERAGEAARHASDGDTLSVHPVAGGPPGLYTVHDHPGDRRELRHVPGTPRTLLPVAGSVARS